jgi:hypothetical protein
VFYHSPVTPQGYEHGHSLWLTPSGSAPKQPIAMIVGRTHTPPSPAPAPSAPSEKSPGEWDASQSCSQPPSQPTLETPAAERASPITAHDGSAMAAHIAEASHFRPFAVQSSWQGSLLLGASGCTVTVCGVYPSSGNNGLERLEGNSTAWPCQNLAWSNPFWFLGCRGPPREEPHAVPESLPCVCNIDPLPGDFDVN